MFLCQRRHAIQGKRQLKAKVVGADAKSDLAVLKIEGDLSGLKPLEFADSTQVRPGQIVLAIGNPFGVGQTVTMGIVSATSRADLGIEAYEDFIQTDAAINPGNSGGALVDLEGKLVGVPTAILSRTGGYMGVGFAIPSNLARRIISELVEHGTVRRGSLGRMIMYPLTSQLAEQLGLKSTAGALVNQIDRRSPAFQAGVEPGDVIVSFNGQEVSDPTALIRLVADAPIGSTATVVVMREGRQVTLKIPVLQRQG